MHSCNDLLLLFVQLADRTLILKQKEFFVFIMPQGFFRTTRLASGFHYTKKGLRRKIRRRLSAFMKGGADYPTMKYRTMSAHSRYMIGWISLALPRTSLTSTCTMMPAPRPLVMVPVKAVNIIMTHGPMDSS